MKWSLSLQCATFHWLLTRRWSLDCDPPLVSSPGPDPLDRAAARGLWLERQQGGRRYLRTERWGCTCASGGTSRRFYSHLSRMRLVSELLYRTSCLNICGQRRNTQVAFGSFKYMKTIPWLSFIHHNRATMIATFWQISDPNCKLLTPHLPSTVSESLSWLGGWSIM